MTTDQTPDAIRAAIAEDEPMRTDLHPDQEALHRTYDTYVTQGMEDHQNGSLRPDDFITRLLNAGVVVRMKPALAQIGAVPAAISEIDLLRAGNLVHDRVMRLVEQMAVGRVTDGRLSPAVSVAIDKALREVLANGADDGA